MEAVNGHVESECHEGGRYVAWLDPTLGEITEKALAGLQFGSTEVPAHIIPRYHCWGEEA